MHRPDHEPRGFVAQLQVQVPRNTSGDLEAGVVQVLERIDPLLAVEAVSLQGLVPRLNDLAVEARVEGRMKLEAGVDDPRAQVERTLEGGFGVAGLAECTLRGVPADDRTPVFEYG